MEEYRKLQRDRWEKQKEEEPLSKEDEELARMLQLEEQNEYNSWKKNTVSLMQPTSLEDENDPHPNLHQLFSEFNALYFDAKLDCIEVKWSKRMTL